MVEHFRRRGFVDDVDVDLRSVDDDRGPAEAIERLGEVPVGVAGEDRDDLELLGRGLVEDLRGAGHLGEHRVLRGPSGHGRVEEVEEFDDAGRPGVDDLGFAEHGKLTGRLPQGLPGAQPHRGDEVDEIGPGLGLLPGLGGHGVEHGEHGSVNGPGYGLPGPGGGELEGCGHGVGGGDRDLVQGVGDSLQGHGEDETGVAARSPARPGSQGGDDLGQGDGTGELFDGEVGAAQGVVHVRAGVPIRNGEDIEFVDLAALLAQTVDGPAGPSGGQAPIEADGVIGGGHVTSRNG